jgi:predicted CoA-binding protein
MKKTLVLGASPNPNRMSNMVTQQLKSLGHEVIPLGIRKGEIDGLDIETERADFQDIDTITLYLNPNRQKDYYEYILNLKPRRIIFNPGTENFELVKLARDRGIEPLLACTKVMLSVGQY